MLEVNRREKVEFSQCFKIKNYTHERKNDSAKVIARWKSPPGFSSTRVSCVRPVVGMKSSPFIFRSHALTCENLKGSGFLLFEMIFQVLFHFPELNFFNN